MSKPVLEDLFRFSGRRNRKSYVLYALVLMVLMAVVMSVLAMMVGPDDTTLPVVIGGLVIIPVVISAWAVGSQRCRDFGWSGWAILLSLVPLVGGIFAIAILFIPGTPGPNRYGPDPIGGMPVPAPAY